MTNVVACTLAALAVVLAALLIANPLGARARLRRVGVRRFREPRAMLALPINGRHGQAVVAAAGVATLALATVLAGLVGAVAVTAYGLAGWRALRQQARAKAAEAARAAGGIALAGLADDLRAGQTPLAALHTALVALERAPVDAEARAALAAVRTGVHRPASAGSFAGSRGGSPEGAFASSADGDVVAALRAVPGPLAPALRRLAAAWALTDNGIPLAEVVDRLDVELRQQRRAADRAQTHTASARMTSRLVASLPLLGLGIGQLLGADPFAVLTGRLAGAVCAIAAVVLHLIGFAWASRLGRVVPR